MVVHLDTGTGTMADSRHRSPRGISRRIADSQVANWGLPLAAISDVINKDEEFISGVMSPTLAMYS